AGSARRGWRPGARGRGDTAGGRPAELEVEVVDVGVDVVVAPAADGRVTGRHERAVIQVDAADEGELARPPGVDQPALLMMAVARQVVPAGEKARAPRREPGAFLRAAREVRRAGQEPAELRLPPEERAHV